MDSSATGGTCRQGPGSRVIIVELFAHTASGEQGRTSLGTSFHQELDGVNQ